MFAVGKVGQILPNISVKPNPASHPLPFNYERILQTSFTHLTAIFVATKTRRQQCGPVYPTGWWFQRNESGTLGKRVHRFGAGGRSVQMAGKGKGVPGISLGDKTAAKVR